jgi:predicted TIM-barrel fold metal-dependent hydrolase
MLRITWLFLPLAALLSGCASLPARRSAEPTELRVIDAHTHTIFTGKREYTSQLPMTEEEFVKELKEVNGVGAIAHTIPDSVETHLGAGTTFHDLRSRGVFHCAGVSGRIDAAALEAKLRSGLYRCIKIYLGYVHQYAHDAHYEPAYRLAEQYDVAVVFHTGDTYSEKGMLKYSHPLTIDEVAVRHPNVRFVIAHCGDPWIQDAAEVAYKNPNVYLDGSALAIGDLDSHPQEKIDEYMVKPLRWIFGYLEDPKKLMYGTDWPLTRMAPYFRNFKRAIPEQHWKAVFHDNAVRVFKLGDEWK